MLSRGLVVGEVGRGTFVSGEASRGVAAPGEPRGAGVDLEFNYPLLVEQTALIGKSLAGLDQPAALDAALRQGTSVGSPTARSIAAAYLSQGGWSPAPEQLVFTGNGRQSIAAALAGTCRREGAPRGPPLGGLYPARVQNPLGMTMTAARRADLLRIVETLGLAVIEDNVYGFLADAPPLAGLAPQRCIVLDSLLKKAAPGLTLGFVVLPQHLLEGVMAAVRSGGPPRVSPSRPRSE